MSDNTCRHFQDHKNGSHPGVYCTLDKIKDPNCVICHSYDERIDYDYQRIYREGYIEGLSLAYKVIGDFNNKQLQQVIVMREGYEPI